MKNVLMTNLRFFTKEDGSPADLPESVWKTASFFGGIAEAVSSRGSEGQAPTGIGCRRRPGHKKCAGEIVAGLETRGSSDIHWRCPSCGDTGILSGWRGTHWDKSGGRTGNTKRRMREPQPTKISLNELEGLLSGIAEDALTIPGLHGFLSAVIVGPEAIMPGRWLPRVFNHEGKMPAFASKDAAGRVLGPLFDFYNQIIRDMDEGAYLPVLGAKWSRKREVRDPLPWCAGFMEGIDLNEDAWLHGWDETLSDLMVPIYYFINPGKFRELVRTPSGRTKKGFEDEMISGIRDAVPAIRNYWRGKAEGSGSRPAQGVILPFERGKKMKAGRNDPCPCGSGKKFKHCCGRETCDAP